MGMGSRAVAVLHRLGSYASGPRDPDAAGGTRMNIWDIILTVLLTAAVLLAVRKIRNDRKAGRVSCGGNCSACSQICSWSATREFIKK